MVKRGNRKETSARSIWYPREEGERNDVKKGGSTGPNIGPDQETHRGCKQSADWADKQIHARQLTKQGSDDVWTKSDFRVPKLTSQYYFHGKPG